MDDDRSDALSSLIGARLRARRQQRGWTLDQLAERSGVSRRMLVTVEQGAANPSIAILLRLSDALGIGLPTLVAADPDSPIHITRDGDRAPLWTSPAGGRAVLTTGTEAPDVVELWDWTLGPGDDHTSEAHSAGTRELVHVLAGTVIVTVADQEAELRCGDAATFPGDVPHGYRHAAGDPARFCLAVFEPGVGQGGQR